ncbi:MAG: radical SAM protein [Candidatus Omnitrophica bacterium]|nr:radical SAM protein [Candidatus Omnitrophota bacterium]
MLAGCQNELQISLTDRCQLSCRYCYLDRDVQYDLSWPAANKAVSDFLQGAAAPRTISFYGGEPLLAFPLLKKIVNAVRRNYSSSSVALNLATNGILLDRKVAEFCAARAISVSLSLDGVKERHESQRAGGGSGGSYAAVLRASRHLQVCRVPVVANMVIRPADAAGWLDDFLHIIDLGFTRVHLLPDVTAVWRPVDINCFRRTLADFVRCNIDRFQTGNSKVFALEQVRRLLYRDHKARTVVCNKRILAADGQYYGCDKVLGCAASRREEYQSGEALVRFDQLKRRKVLSKLRRKLPMAGSCQSCRWRGVCFCPAGIPLVAAFAKNPERCWRSFCRISGLLLTACSRIISAVGKDPGFRRIYGLH